MNFACSFSVGDGLANSHRKGLEYFENLRIKPSTFDARSAEEVDSTIYSTIYSTLHSFYNSLLLRNGRLPGVEAAKWKWKRGVWTSGFRMRQLLSRRDCWIWSGLVRSRE